MPGRFPTTASLLLGALLLGSGPGRGATLAGTVRDTTGSPVANATVSLWEAAPIRGTGILCPSCYPDCAKRVRTGRDGRFAVAGLDDSLRFRVLVVAMGFRPAFIDHVLPSAGPIAASLVPRRFVAVPDSLRLRGVVRDARRRPVAGALLTPLGFRMGSLQAFGMPGDGDPLAVTDDRGAFELVVSALDRPRLRRFAPGLADSTVVWYCRVQARGLAARVVQLAPAEARRNAIELTPGAGVSGRVLHDGRPLADVVVAASPVNRDASQSVGPLEVATDSTGRFFLGNLLPATRYWVHGRMQAFAPYGAAPVRRLVSPPDDSTASVGDLAVEPGRRLAGRLTYEEGGHPPAASRVGLARRDGFDLIELLTDSEGRFGFDALPSESLDVVPPRLDRHLDPATPGLYSFGLERVRIADRGDVEMELRLLPGPPARRTAAPARDTTKTSR